MSSGNGTAPGGALGLVALVPVVVGLDHDEPFARSGRRRRGLLGRGSGGLSRIRPGGGRLGGWRLGRGLGRRPRAAPASGCSGWGSPARRRCRDRAPPAEVAAAAARRGEVQSAHLAEGVSVLVRRTTVRSRPDRFRPGGRVRSAAGVGAGGAGRDPRPRHRRRSSRRWPTRGRRDRSRSRWPLLCLRRRRVVGPSPGRFGSTSCRAPSRRGSRPPGCSRTVPVAGSSTSTTFWSSRTVPSLPELVGELDGAAQADVAVASSPCLRASRPCWMASASSSWPGVVGDVGVDPGRQGHVLGPHRPHQRLRLRLAVDDQADPGGQLLVAHVGRGHLDAHVVVAALARRPRPGGEVAGEGVDRADLGRQVLDRRRHLAQEAELGALRRPQPQPHVGHALADRPFEEVLEVVVHLVGFRDDLDLAQQRRT